ncbi:MAG TPA: histidine phosphatase family protein [Candidatus Nanoarchaeia archaeon]|nr:histidine phosphatase family protein [Candidatus Nanoarchaeia archaeon]
MTEIYVLRHGETAYNKEGRYLGRTDVSAIFNFDKKEIEDLKNHIKFLKFDLIISSPLKRCLETVKILTDRNDILIEDGFTERSVGVYEGLTKEEAREKYPDIYSRNITRQFNDAPLGGETILDVEKRVFVALDKIKHYYQDKKILIITHGFIAKVINKYFNPNITNQDFFSFSLKNLELKKYIF